MTDDANDNKPQPRRRRRAPDGAASPSAAARPGGGQSGGAPAPPLPAADEDPLAALERLQSLTSATVQPASAGSPRASAARAATPAPRPSRARPAAAPRAGRLIARVVAPAVFLVAVVVLLSIVVQSGVIGGKTNPVATPTPVATKTKSGGARPTNYKVYVIKSGDTLSGIALKNNVTVTAIEALNPHVGGSTLIVGTKIKVPKPAP